MRETLLGNSPTRHGVCCCCCCCSCSTTTTKTKNNFFSFKKLGFVLDFYVRLFKDVVLFFIFWILAPKKKLLWIQSKKNVKNNNF